MGWLTRYKPYPRGHGAEFNRCRSNGTYRDSPENGILTFRFYIPLSTTLKVMNWCWLIANLWLPI